MENKKLYGLICCLQRKISSNLLKSFSECSLTHAQINAIFFVFKSTLHNVKVCQRDIENELNLRPSSVSALLSNLEKDGYIKRNVAENDARTKYITLTEKGVNMCKENKLAMDECDKILQQILSEDEQVELKRLIIKVLDSIDK